MHLSALNDLALDRLLEQHLHFTALAEPSLNPAHYLALIDGYLLADKVLQISILVKEIFDDDGVGVYQAVDCPLFGLFLEKLDRLLRVLLVNEHLNCAVEGNSAGFFIVVDVRLVSDDLEPIVCVELLLKSYDGVDLGLLALLSLSQHLLIHLPNSHVRLLWIQDLVGAIEQPELPLDCLVA